MLVTWAFIFSLVFFPIHGQETTMAHQNTTMYGNHGENGEKEDRGRNPM